MLGKALSPRLYLLYIKPALRFWGVAWVWVLEDILKIKGVGKKKESGKFVWSQTLG
jgi:hypothetical protein